MKRGKIYVGTSGYSYPHWREVFYPKGVPQGRWLEHYAEHFGTVELNVTFYRLAPPRMFEGWKNRTPSGFRFAIKGWRMITHRKFLKDCAEQVRAFFDNSVSLGEKLAVVLWQLPPRFQKDIALLGKFLDLTHRASNVRQTVEFRNPSWYCDEVYDLLSEREMALCLADMPRARIDDVTTTDFVYIRRHGPKGNYRDPYPKSAMCQLADKAKSWAAEGKDIFIYLNNDFAGHAIKNAREVLADLSSTT